MTDDVLLGTAIARAIMVLLIAWFVGWTITLVRTNSQPNGAWLFRWFAMGFSVAVATIATLSLSDQLLRSFDLR